MDCRRDTLCSLIGNRALYDYTPRSMSKNAIIFAAFCAERLNNIIILQLARSHLLHAGAT